VIVGIVEVLIAWPGWLSDGGPRFSSSLVLAPLGFSGLRHGSARGFVRFRSASSAVPIRDGKSGALGSALPPPCPVSVNRLRVRAPPARPTPESQRCEVGSASCGTSDERSVGDRSARFEPGKS